ncbi:MAG: hypothetical protein COC05_04430 [Gammaproteobacteria bacterium]|nr:MAG: hypothetical protein COC05_04430 [Gammaproteobacteria bacterium]
MKTLKYLLLAFAVVCAAFISWGWWIGEQTRIYQIEKAPEIEARYGFKISMPQIRVHDRRRQVLAIHPDENGLLYAAGFRDDDIILSHQITALYKALYHQDDKTLAFKVIDGGDGPPLNQRELRILSVNPPR